MMVVIERRFRCCVAGRASVLACACAFLVAGHAARAQNAQSEAGEPRAQTSPVVQEAPEPQAPTRTSAVPKPRPLPAAGATKNATSKAAGVPATAKAGADRLDLGTATVTGDREQPKVMYVVPWKRSDIGDLSGKPMNSLLNEVLAPVDREEFKREVVYYQAVKEDASQNGASTPAAKQGEK